MTVARHSTTEGRHNTPHEAQPNNLAVERAASLLRTAAQVLQAQAEKVVKQLEDLKTRVDEGQPLRLDGQDLPQW